MPKIQSLAVTLLSLSTFLAGHSLRADEATNPTFSLLDSPPLAPILASLDTFQKGEESKLETKADVKSSDTQLWLGVFLGVAGTQSTINTFNSNSNMPSIGLRGDIHFGLFGVEFAGAYSDQGQSSAPVAQALASPGTSPVSTVNTRILTAEASFKFQPSLEFGSFRILPKIGLGPSLQGFSEQILAGAASSSQGAQVYDFHLLLGLDVYLAPTVMISADTRRSLVAFGNGFGDPGYFGNDNSATRSRIAFSFKVVDRVWLGAEYQIYNFDSGGVYPYETLYLGSFQFGF